MSYEPTIWTDGDIITAEKLNKIEDCIASLIDYDKTIWVDGDRITSGLLNKIEDGISRCFNYEKTVWKLGDVITAEKLNKIETALEWAAKPFSNLSWNEVVQSIDDGKYKLFNLGDIKEIDLGNTEGVISVAINGINTDILSSDRAKKASLSFVAYQMPSSQYVMNPTNSGGNADGTGTIGGWDHCLAKNYLQTTIKPLLPQIIRENIKTVVKYSAIFDTSGNLVNNYESNEDLWIPSCREIYGGTDYETEGPDYSACYPTVESRIKNINGSPYAYWTRTAKTNNQYYIINGVGDLTSIGAGNRYGLAIGFCM